MPSTIEVDTARELRDADTALRAATLASEAAGDARREAWSRRQAAVAAHIKAALTEALGEVRDMDDSQTKPGLQAGTRIG